MAELPFFNKARSMALQELKDFVEQHVGEPVGQALAKKLHPGKPLISAKEKQRGRRRVGRFGAEKKRSR